MRTLLRTSTFHSHSLARLSHFHQPTHSLPTCLPAKWFVCRLSFAFSPRTDLRACVALTSLCSLILCLIKQELFYIFYKFIQLKDTKLSGQGNQVGHVQGEFSLSLSTHSHIKPNLACLFYLLLRSALGYLRFAFANPISFYSLVAMLGYYNFICFSFAFYARPGYIPLTFAD